MGSPEFDKPKEGDAGFRLPEEITTIKHLEGLFGVSNRDEPVTGETMSIPPSDPDLYPFFQHWPQLPPEAREELKRELRAYILDFLRRVGKPDEHKKERE